MWASSMWEMCCRQFPFTCSSAAVKCVTAVHVCKFPVPARDGVYYQKMLNIFLIPSMPPPSSQREICPYNSQDGGNAKELVPWCKTPRPSRCRADGESRSDQEIQGKLLTQKKKLCNGSRRSPRWRTCDDNAAKKKSGYYLIRGLGRSRED